MPAGAGTRIPACRPSALARRPLARRSGPLPLVRLYPACTAPLARRPSHTLPSPPGIQPPRAWARPHCRQASSASPPMPAPASAPLSLPAARPPAPSPPTRPTRPSARRVVPRLHRPAGPSPSHTPPFPLRGTPPPYRLPRPRCLCASRVPADACTCIPPGRPRLRRPLARRARLVPLASSRSLGCAPSTAPQLAPHTPPFPRPSSLPALIDAPAPSLGCHARTTADACISLRTCTPACRPAHPLAARSRARTVAFVRLCPSGTATLAQRPLTHLDFAAPRTPYPVPIDAPALPLVFTRTFRPTPASASLSPPPARPLAPSPPTRRAHPSRLPLPLARLRLACAAPLPTASSHTPPLPCLANPRAHGRARAVSGLHARVPGDACI